MAGHDNQDINKRSIIVAVFICIVAVSFIVTGGEEDDEIADEDTPSAEEVASLPPLTARDIDRALDYDLDEVGNTKQAPEVFVQALDVDLNRIPDVDEKKAVFFKIMLPIIASQNDKIRAERQKITDDPADAPHALYEKYDVEVGDVDGLLKRVDVIPASLVLAKAALESGWGSSRFARKGNNFFGMRTYDDDVPGIAPKGATGFKVIKYNSINLGVRMYMQNINKHSAYAKLREARAAARDKGNLPSGLALTGFLTAYSEIPEEYGNRLRSLINANDLSRFDGVRLADN
jgi:Bax protein